MKEKEAKSAKHPKVKTKEKRIAVQVQVRKVKLRRSRRMLKKKATQKLLQLKQNKLKNVKVRTLKPLM